MSKYNLIDIFEQYSIGSGWTNNFDYEGMLNAGLKTRAGDDIDKLKEIFEDFTDVNYHREAEHLSYAIDALEDGEVFEAEGKISDFHAEIRKTMESLDMDTSDDLGAYMASKMEEKEEKKLPMDENEEAVDLAIEASQEKAGIKEGDEVDEIAGYDRKGNKQQDTDGSDASKYKRAAMNKEDLQETIGNAKAKIDEGSYPFDQCLSDNEGKYGKKGAAKVCGYIKAQYGEGIVKEVRIDRDVAERIESFLSISMKAKFLDAWEDLFYDLVDDEPFYVEDVVNHLNNEMHKRIRGNQMAGDRLAGLGENLDDLNDDEYDDGPNGKFVKEINIDKVASPDAKAHDYGAEIKGISDEDDTEEKYAQQMVLPLEEALPKFKGVPPKRDIRTALKQDAKGTDAEIDQYFTSLVKAGDEFDEMEDYVEDFKNYVADKSLQEHFKRFM